MFPSLEVFYSYYGSYHTNTKQANSYSMHSSYTNISINFNQLHLIRILHFRYICELFINLHHHIIKSLLQN
ncbi:hypothetical protein pb186bvf_015941 [Paramecium bursaria]